MQRKKRRSILEKLLMSYDLETCFVIKEHYTDDFLCYVQTKSDSKTGKKGYQISPTFKSMKEMEKWARAIKGSI